jgi:tetratricopeptide (TPR) repeat protein
MTTNLFTNKRQQNLHPTEITNNKEDIQLIWLDENINDSADYRRMQLRLLEVDPSIQFYSAFDPCFDLIKAIKDEQIFFIVSSTFAQTVLEQARNYQTLVAVFIFCVNHQHYVALGQEDTKFVEIFTDQDSLLRSIRDKMHVIEKQALTFSLYNSEEKSLKDLSRDAATFLLHQMLILLLKQLPQEELSKQQMLVMCHDYYKSNPHKLKKIEDFQRDYKSEKAIEWYANEHFLHKLLNKAFRTEDIELIYIFRFFIIDLCSAIEKQYEQIKTEGTVTLYRGTQILVEDLEKLKQNINKIVSINGFFSTSRNRDRNLRFTGSKFVMNKFQHVFFEIQVDQSLKTVSFANMKKTNGIEGEEKVLFNLNSLFKIQSVNFDSTLNVWIVQLNTTDECSEKVQEYLILSKVEIEEDTPIINYGHLLLYELGEIDQAEKYFNILLQSLPSDHPDIASIYNNIGNIHNQRDEWDLALKNFELGYKIRQKRLAPDHSHIAASLNNIGMIHKAKGNSDLALDQFKQALPITEKLSSNNNLKTAMVTENIGKVYSDKNDYDAALVYLLRALKIFKQIQPEQQRDIARCLGTIGYVYEKKNDFHAALNYYHQQLKIEDQCLPFDHPNLTSHLNWIVDTYKKIGGTEKALKLCQEKLNVQKTRLGTNHPCIAKILMIMANLLKQNKSKEALKYYEEALSILENATPIDLQTTSDCLTYMSCLYNECGMNADALRCELKALDLFSRILPSDHIDIATSLRTVGLRYEKLNIISEAFRHYTQSLSVYRVIYEPDHKDIKRVEEDISRIMTKRTSLDLVEADLSYFKEESTFTIDRSFTRQTLASVAFIAEPKSDDTNTSNNLLTNAQSKICVVL